MPKAAAKKQELSFEEATAAKVAIDQKTIAIATRSLRDIKENRTIGLSDLPGEVAKRKRKRPIAAAM